MTKKRQFQYSGSVFRINISYLQKIKFGQFAILGKNIKRKPNLSPILDALKCRILQLILLYQNRRNLQCYSIAWQTHQSNGLAHLDILLKYTKSVKKSRSSFDYLLKDCPQDLSFFTQNQGQKPQVHITPYALTRLNTAILEYGQKEDPQPLSNFRPEDSTRYLVLAEIKADPFKYFNKLVKEDPYNFDLSYYSQKYDLIGHVPSWSNIKSKLNDAQAASRALTEQKKPGIKTITRQLIQQRLTSQQLKTFDSYQCFQTIVDHLNQIPKYGPHRPHKTLNLFIYGPQGIGKTSFINQGPVNLAQYVPNYDIKLQNKYLNRYYNKIYGFISWNEFKYTDFTPTWILQLLEGANIEIPLRYSSNIKRDNPLVLVTSNMSLSEHIERRFKTQPNLITMAKSNLLNERIVQIYVPVPMFFMQKLLVPESLNS